jgi:microsomal dipeptidase-like Zn-dependent dipeptidase
MFSHLAFGSGVMAGTPYSATGGAATALRPDYATDLNLVSIANTAMPVHVCPPLIPNCGRTILHGDHVPGFDDSAGAGTGDGTASNFGAPLFNGWPTWHGTTHQQVYYKWLERAWQGGMRLMVMFGVSNEILCKTSKHMAGTDCTNSMKSIDDQLAAAVAFQAWSEQQPGGGWFQIVRSPEEAEHVIRSGKLAVILGIEADNLFNCKLGSNCTFDFVSAQIDKYYQLGVRHIFPIHDFDNEFGGTAVWMDALGIGNRFIEGQWYDVAKCDADISDFKLANSVLPSVVAETIGKLFDLNHVPYPVYPDTPHCNRKGLTPLGKQLVAKMMDLGMIIDVDHMSLRSLMDTAAMAQERGIGYPLVVGHLTISELYQTSPTPNRHERRRTREQLDLMKRLGGMAGMMTFADDKLAGLTILRPGGARAVNGAQQLTTTDDCVNSSKSLAQTYLFISKEAKIPVGFGSDFNGMAPHFGPRFGDDACNKRQIDGQWQAQIASKRRALANPNQAGNDRPLSYPFVVPGFGTFNKQTTGQRTFDFNTDGFAHIGLYPDIIADLLNVGVATDELEPLMHSAAAYVTVWKRARSLASPSIVNGMEIDTDRLGQDYKGLNLTQADPALCQAACKGEAQCLAWTYVKPNIQGPTARCYLKNAVPGPTLNTCCVSGEKM